MDVNSLRSFLNAFADQSADVDVRLGKVVAQVRDELIDVRIDYSKDEYRSLLVIENEQTYPARTWALNRIAKLPQLADRIISVTGVSLGGAHPPFVAPAGSLAPDLAEMGDGPEEIPVSDALAALLQKFENPLPGATSVLYVTSDAGEGKTTIINRAARVQAEKFKDKKTGTLLIPIPLSGRAFLTFDDAVIAALVNRFRFNYFYFDAFLELVRMGAIVPAFDGYEEMLVEGSKGEAISALGNIVQSLDSSGAVVIAARKAFFEYLSFKTQARLLDAIGSRSASFSRLELLRWTKDQFCKYGRQRGVENSTDIYATVESRMGPDHPILTRAVLVRRLFDVAANSADRERLAELLGNKPADYFFTFVDAIVAREASEKWLARVTGEVAEPLMSVKEHHQLLSSIAQEMWQTSTTSLRYEVLDALVELFAEATNKTAPVVRQIKERIRQHSLLAADSARSGSVAFDHEDFQKFFLGEGLGLILARALRVDIQSFLSVDLVPAATVEQAVQYLLRNAVDISKILSLVVQIGEAEQGFSFCKENSGQLALRLLECQSVKEEKTELRGLYLPVQALSGRKLSRVSFCACQFQPTDLARSSFTDIELNDCTFERLEIPAKEDLRGLKFKDCRIDSLAIGSGDEYTFDPRVIDAELRAAGVLVEVPARATTASTATVDERIRSIERFLRIFSRNTFVDEQVIRLRLGKIAAPSFLSDVIPLLVDRGLLETVQWKGGGMQQRFRLATPMSQINIALERSRGDFDAFLRLAAA